MTYEGFPRPLFFNHVRSDQHSYPGMDGMGKRTKASLAIMKGFVLSSSALLRHLLIPGRALEIVPSTFIITDQAGVDWTGDCTSLRK